MLSLSISIIPSGFDHGRSITGQLTSDEGTVFDRKTAFIGNGVPSADIALRIDGISRQFEGSAVDGAGPAVDDSKSCCIWQGVGTDDSTGLIGRRIVDHEVPVDSDSDRAVGCRSLSPFVGRPRNCLPVEVKNTCFGYAKVFCNLDIGCQLHVEVVRVNSAL